MKDKLTEGDPVGWYECCKVGCPAIRGMMHFNKHSYHEYPDAAPIIHLSLTKDVPNEQCQEFHKIEKFTDFKSIIDLVKEQFVSLRVDLRVILIKEITDGYCRVCGCELSYNETCWGCYDSVLE